VDRGLIRVLDLVFIAKAEDGSLARLEIADLGGDVPEVSVFAGASLGPRLRRGRRRGRPGDRAGNRRRAARLREPLGGAVRGRRAASGAQLVAGGRTPVEDVLVALDALEENE
jgi:hypothetical protein